MGRRLKLNILGQSGAAAGQIPVWNNVTGKWEPAYPAENLLYDAKGDILVGSAADARGRLPVGSNGQVLTADSSQTLGVRWATAAAGYTDPLTTKGDILTRSASVTDRLPIGSNGQVLTADSAQTLGVKWAAAAGAVATDTIWDTKGDLAAATGADAASKLAVGSNGQVLTADSTQSTGIKWATPATTGGILASVAYNPGTLANYSTTSSSATDVDATNLAITFTAPSTGAVVVSLCAFAEQSTSGRVALWHLRESSTTIASRQVITANSASYQISLTVRFKITGLTSGNSYTYKWAFATDPAGGTTRLYAGGGVGMALMEVLAA